MAYLFPLLAALVFALISMQFSLWRTKSMLDGQSRPLADPELDRLTAKMAEAADLRAIKVHQLDMDMVNGLASHDGRIFITRGFMERKRRGEVSAEELASVIAHELGHVELGHTRRRMVDFTGQNVVFVLLSTLLNRFLPGLGVIIANVLSGAVMARLSQRDEFEADAYATAVLIKSGIGAAPQKSLFRKLDALTGNHGSGPPDWLRSHPKTAKRIAAIEANEANWLRG
jgi:metalloprotease